MGRPTKEPPSVSSIVPAIVGHARERGLDIAGFAWRFGLPEDVAVLEQVTAPADAPEELLRAIARAAGEPDVALRVASDLTSRKLKLVELAMRASATAREALALFARWVPLLHDGCEGRLEDEGVACRVEAARWVLWTPHRPRGVGRYVHELVLAYAVHQLRAGAGEWRPLRVWFAHARPPELQPVQAFFGTDDVAFGREDSGLAFGAAELDRPMLRPDRHAVETLAPLVDADLRSRTQQAATFSARVEAHVASSLPHGKDVAEVARAMHMSARTLQRRLEQEGTRFTEVLDRARLQLGRRLLADAGATLGEVAFRLGFADLATFSRAFKRWTGMPPGQWRRS